MDDWAEGTFWDDGNSLYLDDYGDSITIYICQNSLSRTPKRVNFTVRELLGQPKSSFGFFHKS